jgi:hypothetical protein
MGFKLEKREDVILFKLTDNVTTGEIRECLAIVSKLLDRENPFVFIVDTSDSNGIPPLSTGVTIVKWMKVYKPKIIKTLNASSIVFKSPKISALFNWIFTRQTPAAPNKITTSLDDAILFVKHHQKLNLKAKN